jgi:phosphatidate cytidylyltransferase
MQLRVLATRVIAAIVLIPVVVAGIVIGGTTFSVLVAVAAAIMIWEWCRLCCHATPPQLWLPMAATVCGALGLLGFGLPAAAMAVLIAGSLVMVGLARDNLWLAGGTFYLGLACLALVWLQREPSAGPELVLWLFSVVWACDSAAFFVGRTVGGPKLLPTVSPNKTWSGAAAGLVLAALVGVVSAVVFATDRVWPMMAASVAVGVVAQAGDLLESWAKRRFGVKDTGTLIPGHGGMLDRADSLLLSTLAVAAGVILGKVVF